MNAIKPYKDLYGSELVTNGDFSSGSTGWAGDDATLNVSNNTGKVTVTSNAEAGIKTSGISSFVQGKKYKLTFDIVSATGGLVSGTIKEYSNSNIVGSWDGVGSYTIYFTYKSSLSQLRWLSSSSVGDILEIDNVSVVEDLSGDFDFERNSAATRVNAQGLVENVQIISPELV